MKFSFFTPHLKVSGGVRIILGYAHHLAARGHDVTVYVESRNPLRRILANFLGLRPRWMGNFKARIIRVPAFVSENVASADVLVATSWKSSLALADLQKERGRQFYLIQHDEGLYHGPRELVDRTYNFPQRKIVVSTWLKNVLKERSGQDAELLLNPVDGNLFRQVPRTAPGDTVRILLLDHPYAWKGTQEGVAIVQEIKETLSNVRLVMFGAKKKTAAADNCDEYHYNVPQRELAQLYSNADIYLCPSWDEGFGLPSVEAMRCGAALVTYDNGGSRDYAFDGRTAYVAPHRDQQALRARLEEAVNNAVQRKRIADAGMRFVLSMPDWEVQTIWFERILAA